MHALRRPLARTALALVATLWAAAAWCAEASAASSLDATVERAAVGSGPVPVTVGLRIGVTAARGELPPTLRALAIALPEGIDAALAGTAACDAAALGERGPAACPPASELGSGDASFLYVVGALRLRAATEQLTLFRGERREATGADAARTELLLYLRVAEPAPFEIVLRGSLTERAPGTGSLVALDLEPITRIAGGGRAVVTATTLDLTRGLAAGACPAAGWKFAARLEFVGGGIDEPRATAPCGPAAGSAPPALRVSAPDGTATGGARFAIRLSEPATVRLTLERRTRAGWIRVRRATFFALPGGASIVRIRRAGGRPLAAGRYRARVRAAGASGLLSPKRSVTFRLRPA